MGEFLQFSIAIITNISSFGKKMIINNNISSNLSYFQINTVKSFSKDQTVLER